MKLNEIIGKEIVITGYDIKPSKYKDDKYLTLQILLNGNVGVVFTGSGVLMDQISRYSENIPFITKIMTQGKYYAFT